MSPFSLIPGPPGAQLCGAAGGDVLAPKPLHGQLQHLCRLQWASPAVSFWKVFQRGVWRPASRSFPPPWKFPTMKLLKPPVALLPPHLVMKDSSLVARQGTEQLRFQNETCREFSKERLPNRWLIGPRGSPFGIQAASQEGISSCSGPGARRLLSPGIPPAVSVWVALAGYTGPCTSLMLNKCWLLNSYIGELIRKDKG
uniref:Uncharacterized protein n=1 Tax=Rousettus aegyptiacus TaxID=9407 RepID=A0A7J8HT43_ROUAE|nr:hypothetical protein HJG63_011020 [Rousettus aegyptiacus]